MIEVDARAVHVRHLAVVVVLHAVDAALDLVDVAVVDAPRLPHRRLHLGIKVLFELNFKTYLKKLIILSIAFPLA